MSLTVLLVDDNRQFLRASAGSLRRHGGFVVLEASTGADARVIAATRSIDVAVVDMFVGDTDGERLAVSLRAMSRKPGLKVLLLSGAGYSGDAFDGPPLLKPVTTLELSDAIRAVRPLR